MQIIINRLRQSKRLPACQLDSQSQSLCLSVQTPVTSQSLLKVAAMIFLLISSEWMEEEEDVGP